MTEITGILREFIVASYLPGESPANLLDDTRLQTSGILDSMAMLGLVTFIESRFDVEVAPSEMLADEFDRLRDIAALIGRKRSARSES